MTYIPDLSPAELGRRMRINHAGVKPITPHIKPKSRAAITRTRANARSNDSHETGLIARDGEVKEDGGFDELREHRRLMTSYSKTYIMDCCRAHGIKYTSRSTVYDMCMELVRTLGIHVRDPMVLHAR
jgi:hypothetical protein